MNNHHILKKFISIIVSFNLALLGLFLLAPQAKAEDNDNDKTSENSQPEIKISDFDIFSENKDEVILKVTFVQRFVRNKDFERA